MNDKKMLDPSAENLTDQTLDSQKTAEGFEESNTTDSQLNTTETKSAETAETTEVVVTEESAPAESVTKPKATRKRTPKAKPVETAETTEAVVTEESVSAESVTKPKATRKRTPKAKPAETAEATETLATEESAPAESATKPKATRKRTPKAKPAETAESAETVVTEESVSAAIAEEGAAMIATDAAADAENAAEAATASEVSETPDAPVSEQISEDAAEAAEDTTKDDGAAETDGAFIQIGDAEVSEAETDGASAQSGEGESAPDTTSEDGQIAISLFSALDSLESTDSPAPESNNRLESGEEILHPDDLFSVRTSSEVLEKIEVSEESRDTEKDESAHVTEEGQYVIPELDVQEDEEEEEYEEEEEPEKYDPKNPRKIDGRFDLMELFVFTLLAVMIITTFFFRHSVVKGDSMKNTLYDGEHLIISDFFYTPERGDIIVCQDYTAELNTPIIKRVIAVGGDEIRITTTAVYVNGEMLKEDYVYIDDYAKPYRYTPMRLTVPEGEVFVMGDHRNDSMDSRYLTELGTVSEDAILGKVLLRFYPFSKFGTVE